MNNIIQMDSLKKELIDTQNKLYCALLVLDKIKDKLKQEKVSKREIMDLLNGVKR